MQGTQGFDLTQHILDLVSLVIEHSFLQVRRLFGCVEVMQSEMPCLSCPLRSGPSTILVWIRKEKQNAIEEAQAGGDHRQAA